MNVICDRHHDWWAILTTEGQRPHETEVRLNREEVSEGKLVLPSRFRDERLTLVRDHPFVGRLAFWPAGTREHTAVVRAVVWILGVNAELLLEDWTGYPWVRIPFDASALVPVGR